MYTQSKQSGAIQKIYSILMSLTEGDYILYIHSKCTGGLQTFLPQKAGILHTTRLQAGLGLRLVILSKPEEIQTVTPLN